MNKKHAVILKGFDRESVINQKGQIINYSGIALFDSYEECWEFFLREYGYK